MGASAASGVRAFLQPLEDVSQLNEEARRRRLEQHWRRVIGFGAISIILISGIIGAIALLVYGSFHWN